MNNNPIGIFDSGVGGTSIWQEIHALLPNENTLYLADSKHAPYGEKSKQQIRELAIKNTEYLLDKKAKIIVVACNTATTNAIAYLRCHYPVPFIGIEPAIKPASLHSQAKKIGVLATKGTLHSELFEQTSAKIDNEINIISQVGEGLVELIENGQLNTSASAALLHQYIDPMLEKGIDHLVLGCTHYPYLTEQINALFGRAITVVDSGKAVATHTYNVLKQHNLLNTNTNSQPAEHLFLSNQNPAVLHNLLASFSDIIIKQQDF